MSEVWIGCARIPDVPAWAFRRVKDGKDPFLVVDQDRIVGASRTPRRKGVERGMTRLRARSLCEAATTHSRDPNAERTAWEGLLRSLNTLTPRIESARPGRAWIEPTDGDGLRDWLKGRECHCGVGPNRPVALLAAWKAAEGRIICIEPQHEESFLSGIPVQALSDLGFSEDTTERLALFGYEQIQSLRELTRRHLTAQFGEEGDRLFDFLHSDGDRVSFYSPPPSVTVSRDFERDISEPGPLRESLEEMAEDLEDRLEGKACQRLLVRLIGRHDTNETSRLLREPISGKGPIYRASATLLKRALTAEVRVQSLTLEARGLRSTAGTQGNLFEARPALRRAVATIQEKHSALYKVVRNEGAVFEEERYSYKPVAAGD